MELIEFYSHQLFTYNPPRSPNSKNKKKRFWSHFASLCFLFYNLFILNFGGKNIDWLFAISQWAQLENHIVAGIFLSKHSLSFLPKSWNGNTFLPNVPPSHTYYCASPPHAIIWQLYYSRGSLSYFISILVISG